MKIGIITEFFPSSNTLDLKGGLAACAFNEGRYLAKKHDVTVITSNEPPGSKKRDNIYGMNVIRCGKERNFVQSGSLGSRFSFMMDAYKTGAKEDFDIIVGYNFTSYPAAWRISKKLKIPCVLRYHDLWIGQWIKTFGIKGIFGYLTERYVLSRDLDMILSVSQYTKNKLKKYFDPEKIIVVPNIVDVPSVDVQKYQKPTICCVSRVVRYKRIDDLLGAVSIIKESLPDIQCRIIGPSPDEAYLYELKKLAQDLKIVDNVEFCGFIEDHDDVLKVVKSSHVFCFPSVVEGFGIVMVEAMALGTPFVASNIPPLVEASGGKGGLFFQPENYKDMADKIKRILDDEELQNKFKKEGMIKSREYKGEKVAEKIEEIFKNLIKRK